MPLGGEERRDKKSRCIAASAKGDLSLTGVKDENGYGEDP